MSQNGEHFHVAAFTFLLRFGDYYFQLSHIQMQQQNQASADPQPQPQSLIIPKPEWHASEIAAPDPCNSAIRKIAGKQVYLKDKPEMLILLQAAEIERLTGYLNDYKCKYRTLSKEPLDRQSYEIQIKELFQRDSASKLEIGQLTRTITTITTTSQSYKSELLSAQQKNKILATENRAGKERSSSLEKQLIITRDNYDRYIAKAQAEIYSISNQYELHRTYTESVLKNNADLLARVNTIPNYERRIFELEAQLGFNLGQIQRMNKELEVKSEKLINQERGYATLYERHKSLQTTHEDVKSELASQVLTLDQSKLLLSKIQLETQQVKNMHDTKVKESAISLSKRTEEIEALTKQLKDYNSRLTEVQRLNEDLRRSLADAQTKNAGLKQEITRLNDALKQLQDRITRYELDITSLKQVQATKELEWQTLQNQKLRSQESFATRYKQINDRFSQETVAFKDALERKDNENAQLTKKVSELEKALHVSKGQLKVSQQIIKTQQTENARLTTQEELLKATLVQKENLAKSLKQKTASISQLEKTLKQEKEKEQDLSNKLSTLTQKYEEVNKRFSEQNISLNKMIHNKVTESENLKRQLINNENELRSQFQSNIEAQIKAHAQSLAKIKDEKTALSSLHNELQAKNQEIAKEKSELSNKHALLNEDYEGLQAKINELQINIKQYTLTITELRTTVTSLTAEVAEKTSQIEQLSQAEKKLQQASQTSQKELTKLKEQINKLRGQSIKFNSERSCFNMEIYELKQEINKLKTDISKSNEETAKNQEEIAKLKQEREQLSIMFQNKTKENQGLKRRMIELQNELRESFEEALQETQDTHSKNVQLFEKEKEKLNKKIVELEPHVQKASELTKHKEYLEATLKAANINSEIERNRSTSLTEENELLRKALINTETQLKSYYENELSVKDKLRQQEIAIFTKEIEQLTKTRDQLKAERDTLFNLSTEYQARTTSLLQEIQRLHSILNNNIAQNKSEVDLVRSTNLTLQSELANLAGQFQDSQKQNEQLTTSYKLVSTRITYYEQLIEELQTECISIQLLTSELRQERDLLIKKNTHLVKSIRTLCSELEGLDKQGDNISKFFTKQSSIHKDLGKHFSAVQHLFGQLESSKLIIEEKTVEIVQVASK